MRTIRRAVHMDFHTMPDIPDFGRGFDADKFALTLEQARVDYITFFARCNIGYSYFDTQVGLPHPFCDTNLLGEVLNACHRRDIAVAAYLNAGLDHTWADLHPEWNVLREDGSILHGDRTANFFRSMCYNSGYRDHLKAEVEEVLARFPTIDGIFLDCMVPVSCYCPACLDRMRAEGIDSSDPTAVELYATRVRTAVTEEIRAIVPEGKFLFFNGSFQTGAPFPSMVKNQTHHEIECLPTAPFWAYDTFPAYVAYARNVFDQVVFMTGRFQENWGDLHGLRPREAMEFDCYYALAQGAVTSVGDHMHPRDFLEPAVYESIGAIYRDLEKTEPWTLGSKPLAEVGVLFPLDENRTEADKAALSDALAGAARLLGELHLQFDIVDDSMDISRYRLVILPDLVRLEKGLAEKLSTYLASGGTVLSSGHAGLTPDGSGFALPEWQFRCKGDDPWTRGFYRLNEGVAPDHPALTTAIYQTGIAMEAESGTEVLAAYWKPYFNRHWDGHQGYFYIPADSPNGDAAVARAGQVTHICFPLFTAYLKTAAISYKLLLKNLLGHYLEKPLIVGELPSYARVSLTSRPEGGPTLLHILAYCPEFRAMLPALEEGIPLRDLELAVHWGKAPLQEKAPSRVYEIPSEAPVSYDFDGEYVRLHIPKVDGHAIIALE
ncbi:MAG: beta-galactosidase trimerization domain-containing protein [Oscillospiraceae bacterium]